MISVDFGPLSRMVTVATRDSYSGLWPVGIIWRRRGEGMCVCWVSLSHAETSSEGKKKQFLRRRTSLHEDQSVEKLVMGEMTGRLWERGQEIWKQSNKGFPRMTSIREMRRGELKCFGWIQLQIQFFGVMSLPVSRASVSLSLAGTGGQKLCFWHL